MGAYQIVSGKNLHSKAPGADRRLLRLVCPGHRGCESPGIKILKVVYRLADSNVIDRQTKPMRKRHKDASFGCSIELGHDEACQRDCPPECVHLRNGVLAGG